MPAGRRALTGDTTFTIHYSLKLSEIRVVRRKRETRNKMEKRTHAKKKSRKEDGDK